MLLLSFPVMGGIWERNMGYFLIKTVWNSVNLGEILTFSATKMAFSSKQDSFPCWPLQSSIIRARRADLPCSDVRVWLEVLRTVLILEQRPPMAGQTVGDQTPHPSPAEERELKYLSIRNMSARISQEWHWKRNEQLSRTLVFWSLQGSLSHIVHIIKDKNNGCSP